MAKATVVAGDEGPAPDGPMDVVSARSGLLNRRLKICGSSQQFIVLTPSMCCHRFPEFSCLMGREGCAELEADRWSLMMG